MHNKALVVLEHALLLAPQQEDFYLQSMLCYEAIGQRSKAMDMYRRCNNAFQDNQNSSLSSQITELAKSFQS